MARNAGVSVENNFVNGLVTEATGLNFPENAVTETWNCVFDPTGYVSRRGGIDRETDWTSVSFAGSSGIFVEYDWESVRGDGNIAFVVQQVGPTLFFFQNTLEGTLSSNLVGTVPLLPHALVADSRLTESPCQFAAGLGCLLISHPYCQPFYVEYLENGTFSTTQITIQTRDFDGLEPRPTGGTTDIDPTQKYNKFNQGWTESNLLEYRYKIGRFPSDYEVWWLYKGPDTTFGGEVFIPDYMINQILAGYITRGNSPAPNGSVTLNEFYKDRTSATGIPNIPIISSGNNRPASCVFHAGRAFYAGVNSQGYSSKVYFSQIVERLTQFGRCYQENDPTSQYAPDLLASDGGVISIPDAGTILKLWSTDNSLLIFATEGVWQVTGSQGIGFSAVDYTVKRISTASTASVLSFVDVDGMPIWWGDDDIYIAAVDTQLGGISIKSISSDKVKTFYQSISEDGKKYAKGAFNNRDRIVRWLYRDTDSTGFPQTQTYSHLLNLDVRNRSFYPWTLPTVPTYVSGLVVAKGSGANTEEEIVVDNFGLDVLTISLDEVTVESSVTIPLSAQFKYTTVSGTTFTYSNDLTSTSADWTSFGTGINSPAYFISGYRIKGDAIKAMQNNYLNLFALTTPISEISVSGMWGYSTVVESGRWSNPQIVRFNNPRYLMTSKKLKIRGHGLALQYRVESVGSSGFTIIGWSSFDSANAGV